jgi:diadenylate cyclase
MRLLLDTILRSLRWQDVVDILVLTIAISAVYRMIRRTVAVQVAVGLLVLLVGSRVADYLGLILTSYMLSAIGAVSAVAIVVLFQAEIRRALGRMSPARWFAHNASAGNRIDANAIVADAAFSLASRRKGALIVIPRQDQVFDHVTAGTLIEARLSAALIDTIFTSASPLHDGAVVIRQGRLLRAGVVLPLATESADPSHGTRHRAALGLACATDALVVCVSEESGRVCLAHDEALEPMPDKARLRDTLQALGSTTSRSERPDRTARSSAFFAVLPHLAIFLAVVAAWSALAVNRSNAVTRLVPLEVRGVSDGVTVDPPRQNSVAVELRGSPRQLERLPAGAVEAYVELEPGNFGTRPYHIRARAPAGIEITGFAPESVQISTHARPAEAAQPNLHGEPVTSGRRPSSGPRRDDTDPRK